MTARRRWSRADEERLASLVRDVEQALPVVGEDALKTVVLRASGSGSLQELADRLEVQRSSLSRCLAGRELLYDVRRALDRELRLPPGGMERLVALLPGAAA